MRIAFFLPVVLIVLLAGCSSGLGTLKGRIVEDGQAVEIDGQAALMFYLMGADGKPDPTKAYSMPLSQDGSFELVASGGAVPPGTYMVSFEVNAPKAEKGLGRFKGRFSYPESTLRQEVKAGPNDLTIDVAKGKS